MNRRSRASYDASSSIILGNCYALTLIASVFGYLTHRGAAAGRPNHIAG
jgi:hypothetical protein